MLRNRLNSKNILFSIFINSILIFNSCTIKKTIINESSISSCKCTIASNANYNHICKLGKTNSIILCANKSNEHNYELLYSLYIKNCSNDDTLNISSEKYIIKEYPDTIELIPFYLLPQGDDYTYNQTTVFVEKIFITADNKLQKINVINPNFPKYTQSQILDIFEEFQLRKANSDEQVILLMDKLLMASLSDNQLAMKTFKNFEAKYKSMNPVQKERYELNKQLLIDYLSH